MKLLVENRRCIIQAYELDDDTYNIDDRARYVFDRKELIFPNFKVESSENIELFIRQSFKEIIGKVLAWDSDYTRSMKIKDNDIVLIKKTFLIATVTGVYMSKDYFEVDNNEENYHRDELVLWSRGGANSLVSSLGIFLSNLPY